MDKIPQKKILIVDDDDAILESLSFMLESEGYSTITNNGDSVLSTALSENPQLILLDIMLGVLDGRTIAATLKNDDTTKHIPIIFISASSTMNKNVAIDSGVEDFIPKPFEMEDLLVKVATYTS